MMQFKFKNKVYYEYSYRRLLYALIFLLFCVIDQRTKTGTGLDGWIETFRDLLGVGMAVIIMSHYKWEDFLKWKLPYITWSVVSVVGGIGAFIWGLENKPFLNDWIVVIADVVLFGYVLIHTFISVVLEKRYPKLNKAFGITWVAMMVWMVLSGSDYLWPLYYLIMFGCFYLTDYSKEAQTDLFQGMLDGIIWGFFVLSGLSCVFRPYDMDRYTGMYHNPNMNTLFYLVVLVAVLSKLVYVVRNQCNKWVRVYYWLGAGVLLTFILLTIGRSGWVATIIFVFLFLWVMNKMQLPKKLFLNALKNVMILTLCTVITFPICFAAIRYLPPVFHHPIWFWGEWSDTRVHSWDPWDSEKYTEFDEYLEHAFGRIAESFENLLEHSPLAISASAAEVISTEEVLTPDKIPVLTNEEGGDAFLVRSTIYKHYFSHLNMLGQPYEEQGFQLTEYYWIGHAHNIFLQYGTDFGIPMLVVFVVLLVWGSVIMLKKFLRALEVKYLSCWMFMLVPALFGMFEYSWGVSALSITMLFIAWRQCVCEE